MQLQRPAVRRNLKNEFNASSKVFKKNIENTQVCSLLKINYVSIVLFICNKFANFHYKNIYCDKHVIFLN